MSLIEKKSKGSCRIKKRCKCSSYFESTIQIYSNARYFWSYYACISRWRAKILTLRQCLEYYIDHRKTVILRRTQFDLDKALARAHILEGLKIALDNIDEVIEIIRNSYDDAKERLMERFGLSDIQAQAILDMRLKTLSGLQREKIEEEYAELMKLIEHLRAILASDKLVYDIIKEELLEIKDKYGDERKTKIVAAEGEFEVEDLIKDEQCVVALTHFGYIKRMPIDTYKSQKEEEKE